MNDVEEIILGGFIVYCLIFCIVTFITENIIFGVLGIALWFVLFDLSRIYKVIENG